MVSGAGTASARDGDEGKTRERGKRKKAEEGPAVGPGQSTAKTTYRGPGKERPGSLSLFFFFFFALVRSREK